MKVRVKILVLCAVMGALVFPCAAASAPSQWAVDAVEQADILHIIPEGLDTDYQRPITRAEFAQVAMYFCAAQYNLDPQMFLWEYRSSHAREGEIEMSIDWNVFSDVTIRDSENIWPIYAAAFGIVAGRGDGTFDPEGAITRQEAAAMLASTYKLYAGVTEAPTAQLSFLDAQQIAPWAADAVEKIVSMGVMAGVDGNRFAPEELYTREQCYVTFMALYQNAPISKLQRNVPGLYSPEEYVEYLSQGRMTTFEVQGALECELAYIIYGRAMSFTSSETRIFVIYRNGLGGYYGKSFSYPVSPIRGAGYDLDDVSLENEGAVLRFTMTPSEQPAQGQQEPERQTVFLDILTGEQIKE